MSLADGVCDMDSSALAADTEYDTAVKENTSEELADLPIVHKIKALCDENGTESGCLPTLEDWEALDKGVNQVCADFKKTLFDKFKLSDQEYRVCLLVKIGIGTKLISCLTCHSKSAITNTRCRLYKKYFGQGGTGEDWDNFIRSL